MSSNKTLVEMDAIFNEVKLLRSIIEDFLKKQEVLAKKQEIIIKDININVLQIKENSNLSLSHVMDLSSKVDFDISTLNITSVKAPKAKVLDDKKVKMNITSYFNFKFISDPSSLIAIINEDEIEKLCKTHATEIKNKGKDADKFKANLIYKEIIRNNKNKVKLLRAMKEAEELENTVVNSEVVESIINEDEKNSAISDSEEEDDDDDQ